MSGWSEAHRGCDEAGRESVADGRGRWGRVRPRWMGDGCGPARRGGGGRKASVEARLEGQGGTGRAGARVGSRARTRRVWWRLAGRRDSMQARSRRWFARSGGRTDGGTDMGTDGTVRSTRGGKEYDFPAHMPAAMSISVPLAPYTSVRTPLHEDVYSQVYTMPPRRAMLRRATPCHATAEDADAYALRCHSISPPACLGPAPVGGPADQLTHHRGQIHTGTSLPPSLFRSRDPIESRIQLLTLAAQFLRHADSAQPPNPSTPATDPVAAGAAAAPPIDAKALSPKPSSCFIVPLRRGQSLKGLKWSACGLVALSVAGDWCVCG